jgi:hypothetical protein
VDELADSSGLLHDSAALRERLSEAGYLFFRGLLPSGTVRATGAAVLAWLREGGWTGANGVPSAPPRALNSADGLSDPAFRAALLCAEFNQVSYLAPLRATIRRVLGAAAFSYPVKVLRAVYPERPGPRARGRYIHYDYAVGGIQDVLTSWLPLMEIPVELGGLAVLRVATTGRRSRRDRSAGLNQAGPRPATSPVTCSSSTASPRTRRCRTRARHCGSPVTSAGRCPISRPRPS